MPAEASAPRALFRSAHPFPSLAVTTCGTLLVALAGNSVGVCVIAFIALLSGQLSVGWSNDRIDVERDRRVEHEGKPLAAGEISTRTVDAVLLLALSVTCLFSLLLGWRAGLLHLGAVAVAWLYNLWLKGTLLSWLPYAIAFAALPALATLALPSHPAPELWIVLAGSLLGIAVNFANAKPSLAADPRSDLHGLPDQLGGPASLIMTGALVLAAAALITFAPPGRPDRLAWSAAGVTVLWLALGIPLLWRHAATRRPFYWLVIGAAIQISVLAATARPLH